MRLRLSGRVSGRGRGEGEGEGGRGEEGKGEGEHSLEGAHQGVTWAQQGAKLGFPCLCCVRCGFHHVYAIVLHAGIMLSHWGRQDFPHKSLTQYSAVRWGLLESVRLILLSCPSLPSASVTAPYLPSGQLLQGPGEQGVAAGRLGQQQLQSPPLLRPQEGAVRSVT